MDYTYYLCKITFLYAFGAVEDDGLMEEGDEDENDWMEHMVDDYLLDEDDDLF